MTDLDLEKWEAEAQENIVRSYMAESVQLTALNWTETNDIILMLINEVRKLRADKSRVRSERVSLLAPLKEVE